MSYKGFTRSVIIKLMIPGYRNVVIENYITSVKILNITNAVGLLYTMTQNTSVVKGKPIFQYHTMHLAVRKVSFFNLCITCEGPTNL